MALPKIKHPVFKLKIPSTGKVVSYRPYTVQEEKLLLIVRMSEDIDEIIDAVKQIVNNCILDNIDVDSLAMFDIEYIFINLRKVSVGNVVELIYTDEDKKYPFTVDLEQIEVKFNDDNKKTIDLENGLGIVLKYPNMKSSIKVEFDLRVSLLKPTDVEAGVFDMIIDCVDYIFDEEKIYKEFTKEELKDFILSLSLTNLDKIHRFFKTLPAVQHDVEVDVKGEKRRVTLRGMKDFFSF